ncbi:alpha/beta fold hydrolase [Nocardioides ochotonae]|uniref:alpha/beta fold hydrolase n=1 Tax=Nocardioides ochotonae TaxID=2685869 RepID=UPI001408ECEA
MLTTLLNGRAFGEKFGSSEARVVALHGWGRSRADWSATLGGYDALALDLPGFGATPAPETGWDTAAYADWTAEIIGDLDRPVLVGHSFGGRVAVQLAATRPDLVRGLVLTGVPLLRPERTGGSGSGPKLGYRVVRALHRRGLVGDARMEALRQKHGSADYRAAQGVMREVLVKAVNEEYADQLAAVREHGVPVAMVWGEHDTAATVEMARRAQALLGAQATLDVVPGSAHLLDPALVTAIRAQIDRLGGTA